MIKICRFCRLLHPHIIIVDFITSLAWQHNCNVVKSETTRAINQNSRNFYVEENRCFQIFLIISYPHKTPSRNEQVFGCMRNYQDQCILTGVNTTSTWVCFGWRCLCLSASAVLAPSGSPAAASSSPSKAQLWEYLVTATHSLGEWKFQTAYSALTCRYTVW